MKQKLILIDICSFDVAWTLQVQLLFSSHKLELQIVAFIFLNYEQTFKSVLHIIIKSKKI